MKTINRFAIENAGLFADAALNTVEAELHVSVDGVTFVEAGRVFSHRNARHEIVPSAWFDSPLASRPARYIKLAVTKPGADGNIRIASFQVFEDASSTEEKSTLLKE